ncbi:MAG: hypothetical protein N3G80_02950 [Candidatus Micrarchaeota archaeon]|nr:hypothetical protein [Candidatus Micrarchaeota archaeon]
MNVFQKNGGKNNDTEVNNLKNSKISTFFNRILGKEKGEEKDNSNLKNSISTFFNRFLGKEKGEEKDKRTEENFGSGWVSFEEKEIEKKSLKSRMNIKEKVGKIKGYIKNTGKYVKTGLSIFVNPDIVSTGVKASIIGLAAGGIGNFLYTGRFSVIQNALMSASSWIVANPLITAGVIVAIASFKTIIEKIFKPKNELTEEKINTYSAIKKITEKIGLSYYIIKQPLLIAAGVLAGADLVVGMAQGGFFGGIGKVIWDIGKIIGMAGNAIYSNPIPVIGAIFVMMSIRKFQKKVSSTASRKLDEMITKLERAEDKKLNEIAFEVTKEMAVDPVKALQLLEEKVGRDGISRLKNDPLEGRL